ncbi:MAG: DUF4340 domain-containing protein [Gammaproteobacteria bacterium]|nr:MAG: DUF4340 domain-containing protein [Gammaproteobacteria bacterium]
MKRWINLLTLLLGIQIVLGVALLATNQQADFSQAGPLFTADLANADQWVIADEDGNTVTLKNVDGKWVLPDLHALPADSSKLTDAVAKLGKLKRGWPVARTPEAHERFKLTDGKHVRKVVVKKGDDTLASFYLGTSPTFKRIHLRLDGDDNVYAIDFAAYELPAKASDWLDTQVAAVDPDSLTRIEGKDFTLARDGDSWKVSPIPDGKVQDDKGVDALLDDLKTLSVLDVLGTEAKPEYGLDAPVVKWTLTPKSGEPITFTLGKHKDGWYALRRSDQPVIFKVAAYIGDKLAAKGIGPLTKEAPTDEDKAAEPKGEAPEGDAQASDSAEAGHSGQEGAAQ